MSDRAIIYYDADCGFCRRLLRLVLRIDQFNGHLLAPTAIQDPASAAALSHLTTKQQLASWHFQAVGGEVVSGGAAIPELLRLWGWPGPVIALFETFPTATDVGYRWVAVHRVGLSRLTRWIPDLPESFQLRKNPPS